MSLRDIQKDLFAQIFTADDLLEANTGILENHHSSSAISPLSIYRDSIMGGLIHALKETCPVSYRLVGEHFFNAMAVQFCIRTPSLKPDLNEYGASFAEFIQQYEPAKSVIYLADMARLEWLCNLAFMASNEAHNNLDSLSELSEQDVMRVVFYMPAGCYLLASEYPVERIWKMHQLDESDHVDQFDMDTSLVKLLVWRPQHEVSLTVLNDQQYTFLDNLLQQKTLAETCEQCLSEHPAMKINPLIEECIQKGWIQGYYVKGVDNIKELD